MSSRRLLLLGFTLGIGFGLSGDTARAQHHHHGGGGFHHQITSGGARQRGVRAAGPANLGYYNTFNGRYGGFNGNYGGFGFGGMGGFGFGGMGGYGYGGGGTPAYGLGSYVVTRNGGMVGPGPGPLAPIYLGPFPNLGMGPRVQAPNDGTGEILLTVPTNAEVWINGELLKEMGRNRRFVTAPLPPNSVETYSVRIKWKDDTGEHTSFQQVKVRAGNSAKVQIMAAYKDPDNEY